MVNHQKFMRMDGIRITIHLNQNFCGMKKGHIFKKRNNIYCMQNKMSDDSTSIDIYILYIYIIYYILYIIYYILYTYAYTYTHDAKMVLVRDDLFPN